MGNICDELISLGKMAKALGSKALEEKVMPEIGKDSKVKDYKLVLEKS